MWSFFSFLFFTFSTLQYRHGQATVYRASWTPKYFPPKTITSAGDSSLWRLWNPDWGFRFLIQLLNGHLSKRSSNELIAPCGRLKVGVQGLTLRPLNPTPSLPPTYLLTCKFTRSPVSSICQQSGIIHSNLLRLLNLTYTARCSMREGKHW